MIMEDVLTVEGVEGGRVAFPDAAFFRLCKAATAVALGPLDALLWQSNLGEVGCA